MLPKLFSQYKDLDRSIVYVVIAEFFVQLIDYAYITILLQYMAKQGYTDYDASDFLGIRYLSVLLLSFNLGFYIKGRKIRPLLFISAISAPVLSLAIVYAVQFKVDVLIYVGMFLLGISLLGLEVSVLPYLLRNVKEKFHTEAISLNYSTQSLAGIISGLLIYAFSIINSDFFDEETILKIISFIAFGGIFFLYLSKKKREIYVPILRRSRYDLSDFDWWNVFKAMVPTLLVATGAGLVVPFMGLFFYKVHGIDSNQYAMISSITTFIVFITAIYVPKLKNNLGYKGTLVGSQSLAVVFLFLLTLTEFYAGTPYIASIAIACYIFRQPLMSIAMPITSDVTMKFVGFRNREIVSALTAAVWSGSWFFSANIFSFLRAREVSYAHIFYITIVLYIFSIAWYYYLIVLYEKDEKLYAKKS